MISKGQRDYASVQKYKPDIYGHAVFEGSLDVFCTYGICYRDLDLHHVDGYDQLAGPKFSYRHAHWHGEN